MLKDNIFMYYFLKVKEQFISLHLIYIKHFMANNYLLNYWINEVHWGYNYLLVVILLLVISILLYRIRKLQKTIKKTNHSYRFSFDILDNLPFPIFVKDITNDFRYYYWNKESAAQSGISSEEAIGHTDYEIYGEERGEKYRNIDVLLIDDVQFIIGKESTQEEFFHTFNALHSANKQIIISSDRPPKDMETLEARLQSRFEWGLIADISSPDYETRMAILRKKEELDGYNIDDEVIRYIATNIKSNIRELEGALNKLVALSNLEKREINISMAEEVLKDIISPNQKREVTPQVILEVVAEHYGISVSDIIGGKRNAEIVTPRQVVMYLCREITDTPYKAIGILLGNRDHSTIINGDGKVRKQLQANDGSLKNNMDIIGKTLSS